MKIEFKIGENHEASITQPDGGPSVEVLLKAIDGDKVKRFYQASGSVSGMMKHMQSLTDGQCSDFMKTAN